MSPRQLGRLRGLQLPLCPFYPVNLNHRYNESE